MPDDASKRSGALPGIALAPALAAMALRVLVVEDRDYLRQILVAVLQDQGYATTGFSSAVAALERLEELRPDLIVLDLSLPGMDGREFLVRLRSDPRRSDLPVLVISGLGELAVKMIAGFRANLLLKPFDNATLLAAVRRLLTVTDPFPSAASAGD